MNAILLGTFMEHAYESTEGSTEKVNRRNKLYRKKQDKVSVVSLLKLKKDYLFDLTLGKEKHFSVAPSTINKNLNNMLFHEHLCLIS